MKNDFRRWMRLVEDATDPLQTPAFRAWFGGSKIVDASGKPLKMYHGTGGNIHAFDPNRMGQTDHGFIGKGFYFSSDTDRASAYANSSSGNPNVNPVYLAIKKPYRAGLGERVPDRKSLEAAGYDGIVMDLGPDDWAGMEKREPKPNELEIVAFRPEQIKSAIGNSGSFSTISPQISETE